MALYVYPSFAVSIDATGLATQFTLEQVRVLLNTISTIGFLTDAELRATAVPVSGPLTDTQLRASPLALPTGASTLAKQDEEIAAITLVGNKQLVPFAHDEIDIAYVGATTDIDTVTYKLASATVATLTMGYDGNGRLNSVVRS